MDHFAYTLGCLHCEGVDLAQVAQAVGTPTYVYSHATLKLHAERITDAFAELKPLICFAVKCSPNIHVLRTLADCGLGMDVVSGGELARALAAGVHPSKIVFAGVGKTDEEIRSALAVPHPDGTTAPIALFNVESQPELQALQSHAANLGVQARCALRVNPGVKAGGHEYIVTATSQSKFGVGLEHARALLARFGNNPHAPIVGLHMHLGSSILTPQPYAEALRRVLALIDHAAESGLTIQSLDLGGGFGADYQTGDAPAAVEYARVIVPMLRDRVARGLKIILEPGRTIAANAGVLLTRVLYVKQGHAEGEDKKFIICDAGMQTLLRPSLYGAFHFIWPTSVVPGQEPTRRDENLNLPGLELADVVGPVCESGDFLAKGRALPPVARGDLLAVFTAGAYGISMASRYNSHPLPAEVLVHGNDFHLIRRRETIAELLEHELNANPSHEGTGEGTGKGGDI
jgi:diaminopimelate decarboxylase